jgi:hypothetical protein
MQQNSSNPNGGDAPLLQASRRSRRPKRLVIFGDSHDRPWAGWIANCAAPFIDEAQQVFLDVQETIPAASFWRDLRRTSKAYCVFALVSSHLVPHYGSPKWVQIWRKDMLPCHVRHGNAVFPVEVECLSPRVMAGLGSLAWHTNPIRLYGPDGSLADEDRARLALYDWFLRAFRAKSHPAYPRAQVSREIDPDRVPEALQVQVIAALAGMIGGWEQVLRQAHVLPIALEQEAIAMARLLVQEVLEEVAPEVLDTPLSYAHDLARALNRAAAFLEAFTHQLRFDAGSCGHAALELLLIVLQELLPHTLLSSGTVPTGMAARG